MVHEFGLIIEEGLTGGSGGIWIMMKGQHPKGKTLITIGYQYSSRKTLMFVTTEGSGSMCVGKPYEMKWIDEHGNVQI